MIKSNPYLENISKVLIDWVHENKATAQSFRKCFDLHFRRNIFEDYFIHCTKVPTVTSCQKILKILGYELEFYNLNGQIAYDGNIRQFIKKVLEPYRPQYLYGNNLMNRSTYNYIIRTKNDSNELYISLDDFTYLLYKLNIQVILKKV